MPWKSEQVGPTHRYQENLRLSSEIRLCWQQQHEVFYLLPRDSRREIDSVRIDLSEAERLLKHRSTPCIY